ncbi:hypothetical protein FRB99_006135 [Tulasnella sp. 403]|nr:hypothetical protein FRB99_006135 [Tulasnella sp. 403]
MRLQSLPSFLSIVFLVVRAAPVQGTKELKSLTSETFSSSISKGLWLVEHYSPYCPHCRHFEATWRTLTEEYEAAEATSHFFMAQVNCITQGDLCQQNKIEYYPQLKLYLDGVEKETYNGDRTISILRGYINKQIEQYAGGVQHPDHKQEALSARNLNLEGEVSVLTQSNFKSTIEQGPTFIKFFAPWCGHCKRLAPIWLELATRLKGVMNVAEVNCDDNGSLCKQEGVDGYPMLYLYNAGQKVDYRGSRKLDSMDSFARKAISHELKLVDLAAFTEMAKSQKVVYLYLRTISTSSYDISKVEEAAKPLFGDPTVVQSQDPLLWKHFDQDPQRGSVLLAIKHDEVAGTFNVDPTTPVQSISQWLVENKLPLSDELTGDNFQTIMRSSSPSLVVLVAIDTDVRKGSALRQDTAALNEMARTWHASGRRVNDRPVVFVWMDGGNRERGKWLKSMYGIKKNAMPAVVIADHQNLVYYNLDGDKKPITFDGPAVHRALEAVDAGVLRPKHSENVVERFFRSIHNSLQNLEAYFFEHPLKSIFFVALLISVVIYGFWKLIQLDVEPVKRERLD